jgi:tRNA U34 2-thiouridine synthase MnmA/TrmU
MNRKAVALLSGGLDSTLAAKLMIEQGVELLAINFLTAFCTCTRHGGCSEAKKVAEKFGLKYKIINLGQEYFETIKNPKHGRGSGMNACIDCRILTFKKASEYMKEVGASFIVSGEVLGQRPMSQQLRMFKIIEKESGLEGLVVRPLSAVLLEPSLPEIEGVIDRSKLLNISGRSRRPQIALAKEFNINDYPCAAGGCLLTDKGFSNRLKDLMAHQDLAMDEIHLLKSGRHFRLSQDLKLIVGRDESENEKIVTFAKDEDILLHAKDIAGPVGLLKGKLNGNQELLNKAASICLRYSDHQNQLPREVLWWKLPKKEETAISTHPAQEEELNKFRL